MPAVVAEFQRCNTRRRSMGPCTTGFDGRLRRHRRRRTSAPTDRSSRSPRDHARAVRRRGRGARSASLEPPCRDRSALATRHRPGRSIAATSRPRDARAGACDTGRRVVPVEIELAPWARRRHRARDPAATCARRHRWSGRRRRTWYARRAPRRRRAPPTDRRRRSRRRPGRARRRPSRASRSRDAGSPDSESSRAVRHPPDGRPGLVHARAPLTRARRVPASVRTAVARRRCVGAPMHAGRKSDEHSIAVGLTVHASSRCQRGHAYANVRRLLADTSRTPCPTGPRRMICRRHEGLQRSARRSHVRTAVARPSGAFDDDRAPRLEHRSPSTKSSSRSASELDAAGHVGIASGRRASSPPVAPANSMARTRSCCVFRDPDSMPTSRCSVDPSTAPGRLDAA